MKEKKKIDFVSFFSTLGVGIYHIKFDLLLRYIIHERYIQNNMHRLQCTFKRRVEEKKRNSPPLSKSKTETLSQDKSVRMEKRRNGS